MKADDLAPFFRQLRRDTFAAALILAELTNGNSVNEGFLIFAFANADEILKFADKHPEGWAEKL